MIFATKKAPITIQDVCMQPNPQRINAWVRSCSISDLWQQLRLIPNRQALFLFSLLPHREQKEVFLCMDRIDQNTFYFALTSEQRKNLMHWMPMDEIVDFYQSLLVGEKDEFLSSIAPARQAELLRLAQYPEGSIGAVMTTEFFTISSNATIGEVMDLYGDRVMRERELGQFGYVVFDNGHLLGCLDLTKLATYPVEDSVQKWMHLSPVCIVVEASLREAIALSHRQHAKEIAVVDRSFAMIGLLTHDDLLRIEQRELARSLITFGGSSLRGRT